MRRRHQAECRNGYGPPDPSKAKETVTPKGTALCTQDKPATETDRDEQET